MTQPDAETIKMAREALMSDAATWYEAAEVMTKAAHEAASLTLTGFHFGYLPNRQGVGQRYTEAQDFFVRVLNEGAVTMTVMATKLRAVLDNYDRADSGASVRMERAGDQQ
ncbi:hypothetical protein [Plantactinospora soyae]|uniref:Uncharacterized protein n=1 Tax=Plantactinospora soyae TaxID=1544732 RepID=A0A927QW35_9ACTN|nr:hypothetical protein [Plantactinospora soyae]MBE1485072.1 hypothetical protein [Plantactinospora soyae]